MMIANTHAPAPTPYFAPVSDPAPAPASALAPAPRAVPGSIHDGEHQVKTVRDVQGFENIVETIP